MTTMQSVSCAPISVLTRPQQASRHYFQNRFVGKCARCIVVHRTDSQRLASTPFARLTTCRAADDDNESPVVVPDSETPFVRFTRTPWYRFGVEGAVLLGVLALVDAAYSGDWSRVGAISKGTELILQKIVLGLTAGHAVCAYLAAKIRMERGQDWILTALKVFVIGTVAYLEVKYDDKAVSEN